MLNESQQSLVNEHLGVARRAAYSATRRGMPYDVALSGACLGLIQSVFNHDPRKGAFVTVATCRANGQIADDARKFNKWLGGRRNEKSMRKPHRIKHPDQFVTDHVFAIDELDTFNHLIRSLDPLSRKVVSMRVLDGCEFKTIASRLNRSESWACKNFKDSIQTLKQELSK